MRKIYIFLALFLIASGFGVRVKAQTTEDLFVYYPFNGSANDAGPHGYDGEISGDGITLTRGHTGVENTAYEFDGQTRDNIQIMESLPEELKGSDSRTLTIWVYPTQNENSFFFMGPLSDITRGATYRFRSNSSGQLGVDISNGERYTDVTLTLNEWNFIFLKWDGQNWIVGKGAGEELDSAIIDDLGYYNQLDGPAMIGFNPWDTRTATTGKIDEVRLYTSALTSEEIYENYKPTATVVDDAYIYFPLNGNTNDFGGNDHHGTTVGNESYTTDVYNNQEFAYNCTGNNYVQFFDHDIPDILLGNNNKTITMWVKPISDMERFFFMGDDDSEIRSCLRILTRERKLIVDLSYGSRTTDIELQTGEWNFVHIRFDGSNFIVGNSVNGELQTDTISDLSNFDLKQGPAYLGLSPYAYADTLQGSLDEVRIFADYLSNEEIEVVRDTEPAIVTSIFDKAPEKGFTVAPNPSNGNFTVSLNHNSDASYSVINNSGKVLISKQPLPSNGKSSLNLNLDSGIYILQITSGEEVLTEKLIIE